MTLTEQTPTWEYKRAVANFCAPRVTRMFYRNAIMRVLDPTAKANLLPAGVKDDLLLRRTRALRIEVAAAGL